MKIKGERDKFVEDLLKELSDIILLKTTSFSTKKAVIKAWANSNVDVHNLSVKIDRYNEDLDVIYTLNGNELSRCSVEISSITDSSCIIKIGRPRRYSNIGGSFRLKVKSNWPEYHLIKDLSKDVGFQKGLFLKILTVIEPKIASGIKASKEAIEKKVRLSDMEIQFPDFKVTQMWNDAWELEHNDSKITIKMTKELDIETVSLPKGKYVTYPTDEFMERLLGLFEEETSDINTCERTKAPANCLFPEIHPSNCECGD